MKLTQQKYREILRDLSLSLGIVTLLRLAASWYGGTQFWGLDYIQYFDIPYLPGFTILPFLFLVPGIRKATTHFLMNTVAKNSTYFLLLATTVLVLFVSFRMETFFYGDGGLLPPQIYKLGLDQHADKSLLLNLKSSPLPGVYLVALVYAIPYLYKFLGIGAPVSAIYPFIYFSVSAFLIAVFFLLTVKERRERIVYFITLLSSAGALLFFGSWNTTSSLLLQYSSTLSL